MPSRRDVGVVIVAAGQGTRIGGSTPKQFVEIGGVPMLLRSIRPFARHPAVLHIVVVLRAPDGRATVLWADADVRWVQAFTPDDLDGRGRAVAVEPMTCPPDAFNSGTDLVVLRPEQSHTGSWGIRPA